MTADQYVEAVLAKYQVPRGPTSPAERLGSTVADPLLTWAQQYLSELRYSGSYAKETGVHGVSDVDVFISLNSNTPGTLKELYNRLYNFASQQGWSPRAQNVSIGVTINGTRGDLVRCPMIMQQKYWDQGRSTALLTTTCPSFFARASCATGGNATKASILTSARSAAASATASDTVTQLISRRGSRPTYVAMALRKTCAAVPSVLTATVFPLRSRIDALARSRPAPSTQHAPRPASRLDLPNPAR